MISKAPHNTAIYDSFRIQSLLNNFIAFSFCQAKQANKQFINQLTHSIIAIIISSTSSSNSTTGAALKKCM